MVLCFWTVSPAVCSSEMSSVMRKPVFGVPDQVGQKPGCRTTEDGYVEARNLGFRKKRKYSENKGADNLTYAKSRFSHDAAQIGFEGKASFTHSQFWPQ